MNTTAYTAPAAVARHADATWVRARSRPSAMPVAPVEGPPDPRLDEALKLFLAVGAVVVLLLPGARGSVASIGCQRTISSDPTRAMSKLNS